MDLRRAVSATVQYAGFFNFPLTTKEVHHWLISSEVVPLRKLRRYHSTQLTPAQKKIRLAVDISSKNKREHAERLINVLKFVPGLRLVGLTGSVAAGNAHEDDDIDLFFITAPHTLWLVRPLVIFLISLCFRRRYPGENHQEAKDAFCPNLWMDTLSVTVPKNKHSLYTAHEVLQVVPLLDRGNTYQHFLHKNRWVKKYLANAYSKLSVAPRPKHSSGITFLLSPFNYVSYLVQFFYMNPKKTTETVHLHAAYLHTIDFASQIDQHLKSPEDIII